MVFAGAKLRKEYLIAVFIMASFESLSLISWNKFNIFTEKINVLQLIIRNMIGNYKIITLCGSTRFRDEFIAGQKRLTLEGNIVISVGLFGHSGNEEVWSENTKKMLDDMHLRKIDLADEIFVINPGGYIGNSTQREIEYSKKNGKAVRYLEP